MAKESYCPGENLINLVTGVLDFENLDKEPWEFKKSNFVIGDKTLDEFMALSGMDMDEVNKRRVRDYTKREKILSDLLKYGDTKEKILEGLREHVKICLDCSKKYLDYLISYAYCVISLKDIEKEYGHADFLTKGAVKESIEKAKESFKKGIFYILEEGDSKYLNLLDGD